MTRNKSMHRKDRQPVGERLHLKFRVRWRHVLLIDQEIRSGRAPNCRRLAEALEVNRPARPRLPPLRLQALPRHLHPRRLGWQTRPKTGVPRVWQANHHMGEVRGPPS
jgi:hypothetical protein